MPVSKRKYICPFCDYVFEVDSHVPQYDSLRIDCESCNQSFPFSEAKRHGKKEDTPEQDV